MASLVELLPKIAGHPLAILACIILACVWLMAYVRQQHTKVFLKALDRVNEDERGKFAEEAGYKWDEIANLSPRDRKHALSSRYLLIAYVSTVVALALVFVATLIVTSRAALNPVGDRHYSETKLLPGVYESVTFDPNDLLSKTTAITKFLESLEYDLGRFGNFPTKLISTVIVDDCCDLELVKKADGEEFYRLTVEGQEGVLQSVLLRTESEE